METMDAIASKFNGHLLAASEVVQQMTDRNDALEGLDKYRYPTARFMIPEVHELIRESAHVNALRQIALAALACDHYRFTNKEFPKSLSDAIDGFLEDEPIDVYSGEPIIVRRAGTDLLIFSPGPGKGDNGLEHDDIGIRLIPQKWSPLIGPVTEFD
ncbi:MAG: hypothetical protein ACR2NP_00810, partial [Pirellulaceae bacterium]